MYKIMILFKDRTEYEELYGHACDTFDKLQSYAKMLRRLGYTFKMYENEKELTNV